MSIHSVEQSVDLLRIDDGVRWMRGELGLIRAACARGKDVEAVWRLEQVQSRMASTPRSTPARQSCQAPARGGEKCPLTPETRSARRKTANAPTSAQK
jgi:hypothetical protein